jgi:hypothetical protein
VSTDGTVVGTGRRGASSTVLDPSTTEEDGDV